MCARGFNMQTSSSPVGYSDAFKDVLTTNNEIESFPDFQQWEHSNDNDLFPNTQSSLDGNVLLGNHFQDLPAAPLMSTVECAFDAMPTHELAHSSHGGFIEKFNHYHSNMSNCAMLPLSNYNQPLLSNGNQDLTHPPGGTVSMFSTLGGNGAGLDGYGSSGGIFVSGGVDMATGHDTTNSDQRKRSRTLGNIHGTTFPSVSQYPMLFEAAVDPGFVAYAEGSSQIEARKEHRSRRSPKKKASSDSKSGRIRKRDPTKDQDNLDIKYMRAVLHMEWPDIAKNLNDKRIAAGKEPCFTDAAVYGRFVRNARPIAAQQGQVLDPQDFMYLRKDGKRRHTSNRHSHASEHQSGDENEPGMTGSATPSAGFEDFHGHMDVDDALRQAYQEAMNNFWLSVAHGVTRKAGKDVDARWCAARYSDLQ